MKVYKECCQNCLLSSDAIVSNERRKEILDTCKKEQTHFVCHKASMEGEDICCKAFYDKFGHMSQMVRIAQRIGFVRYVEQPASEKLMSHKEMEGNK